MENPPTPTVFSLNNQEFRTTHIVARTGISSCRHTSMLSSKYRCSQCTDFEKNSRLKKRCYALLYLPSLIYVGLKVSM